MSTDDDRIGGRLDEDQERLLAAASPHGLELRQPRKRPLEDHKLTAFQAADNVLTRLTGDVDGALVDVFEYDWVQPGTKGVVTRGRRILTVLRHPAFEGQARCVPESTMSPAGKALLYFAIGFALLTAWWILLPIMLWQYYANGVDPFPKNWNLENPAFRKRFKVHGPSLEEAKRALPRDAQDILLTEDVGGPIEVRPGVFAFGFEGKSLDDAMLERTMRVAKRVVATYAPIRVDAGTAYRVATEEATNELAEAEAEERQREPGSSA